MVGQNTHYAFASHSVQQRPYWAASSKLLCPEFGPKNLGHRHSWFCPARSELTCSQARYGDKTHQNEGSGPKKEKKKHTHYTVANFPLC